MSIIKGSLSLAVIAVIATSPQQGHAAMSVTYSNVEIWGDADIRGGLWGSDNDLSHGDDTPVGRAQVSGDVSSFRPADGPDTITCQEDPSSPECFDQSGAADYSAELRWNIADTSIHFEGDVEASISVSDPSFATAESNAGVHHATIFELDEAYQYTYKGEFSGEGGEIFLKSLADSTIIATVGSTSPQQPGCSAMALLAWLA